MTPDLSLAHLDAPAALDPSGKTDPLAGLSPLRAEISLGALRHNARQTVALARGADVMAAVKADAYGHGAALVARTLADEGVPRFSVANVVEGARLRESGIREPILVLGAPLTEALPAYARYGLDVTVASSETADAVVAAAHAHGLLVAHVKVDTGMHRLGLDPAEVGSVLQALGASENVRVDGLWTHFATVADAFLDDQLDRFDAVVQRLVADGVAVPPLVHVANTGALLTAPRSVAGRQIVRAGGALYGLVSDRLLAGAADLRPVMRLVGRVVQVKTVAAGESVSYGRTWRATGPTVVATVGAGYGDGVPRGLSNRGCAGIDGRLYPVAGRVCMDMLLLDLGHPDGTGARVRAGAEAVLFGPGGPSALDVADAAGTIAYDLTCRLTLRVPRVAVE